MKIHTVIVNEGETLGDALERVLNGTKEKERDQAEVLKELSLDALDAVLSVSGITGYLYSAAEAKLGRKPKRKVQHVPVYPGSLLTIPVDTIDLADAEWFAAMTEALRPILDGMAAIKLDKLD